MAPDPSMLERVCAFDGIVRPSCDKLGYRIVTLANQLRVVLVSDPDTDKAAAALNVRSRSRHCSLCMHTLHNCL